MYARERERAAVLCVCVCVCTLGEVYILRGCAAAAGTAPSPRVLPVTSVTIPDKGI